MKMPPDAKLNTAIAWLESNEGEGDEGAACKAVAAWLEHQRDERLIRSAAREGGVTVAALRRKLAQVS